MTKQILTLGIIALSIFAMTSCNKDDNTTTPTKPTTINEGNDPNFKIVANTDAGFKSFNRKVVVFGIPIYAVSGVEDNKLLHAANVMAQYLDNDEDGTANNQAVLAKMLANKAYLFMWKTEADKENFTPPSGYEGQDLGANETIPNFVSGGLTGQFDASLEEVWHLITHVGYAKEYPTIFGENAGTALTDAMDIARGGSFTSIPSSYPSSAWYTYNDATCNYNCQATEYIYWAMSSILGAQVNRLSEIQNEWKLNTKAKVQATDKKIYTLLTNKVLPYKFPTKLPDGTYKH